MACICCCMALIAAVAAAAAAASAANRISSIVGPDESSGASWKVGDAGVAFGGKNAPPGGTGDGVRDRAPPARPRGSTRRFDEECRRVFGRFDSLMSDGGPGRRKLDTDQARQYVLYSRNTYTISFPHLTRKMIWPAERKEHPWLRRSLVFQKVGF